MSKWVIVIVFLMVFPFAAYAQNNTQDKAMDLWIKQTFGIDVPRPEISQSWKSFPVAYGCNYEWHVRLNDARVQIKDGNDNYYRLSYQGNTLTLDFKRDFFGFFGS